MRLLEYCEDEELFLNGNLIDPATKEELFDYIYGQIEADANLWGVEETIQEWKENNPNIKLPEQPDKALWEIARYTLGWVLDGIWYDGFYDDDVFNLEFFMYNFTEEDERNASRDRKSLFKKRHSKKRQYKPLINLRRK